VYHIATVLGSGLALAERLGAMTGMGSRDRCTRQALPPAQKSACSFDPTMNFDPTSATM
jgi:hypothetical protein